MITNFVTELRPYPEDKFNVFNNLFYYLAKDHEAEGWIAGGAARFLLSKNPYTSLPDDIDLWTRYDLSVSHIYEGFLRRLPPDIIRKIKIYQSRPKVDLKLCTKIINIVCQPFFPNIQIMCSCQLPMGQILEKFDFSVCKAAVLANRGWGYQILYDENFFEDEENLRLRISGNIEKGQLWRIYKYYQKGYNLGFEDVVKIASWLEEIKDAKNGFMAHSIVKEFRENPNDFFIAPYLQKIYENFLADVEF